MPNSRYIETKNSFIDKLKKSLSKDLVAIISVGSEPDNRLIKGWSDLDFLIVVGDMKLDTKTKIAAIVSMVEHDSGIHIGINVISKEEATSPLLPSINLDGKTLQALLELGRDHSRLLFSKIPDGKFYKPSDEEVKKYSLSNIKMLVRRNRNTLTHQTLENTETLRAVVAKEMRAANIIVKLAIQYFSAETATNDVIIQKAKETFDDFDFETLENNKKYINEWDRVALGEDRLIEILRETNNFLESFSDYVYKKATK